MQDARELNEIVAKESAFVERLLTEVSKVIVGQKYMIERILIGLLTGGHVLLEGVPGLAKTLTVRTLCEAISAKFARIQFTPDLLPADVIGTVIYNQQKGEFTSKLGPVFANLVLADEINRAPAKVQSALLEVMQERQVSIGGTTYPLPKPFLVLATQNPIESEGVYPLPEAQRDRFLLKVVVGHPSMSEEMEIVRRMAVNPPHAEQVLSLESLLDLQQTVDETFVHHAVAEYAVRLVMATRDPGPWGAPELVPLIAHGASPRGSLGLVQGGRALAVLRGRGYVLPT